MAEDNKGIEDAWSKSINEAQLGSVWSYNGMQKVIRIYNDDNNKLWIINLDYNLLLGNTSNNLGLEKELMEITEEQINEINTDKFDVKRNHISTYIKNNEKDPLKTTIEVYIYDDMYYISTLLAKHLRFVREDYNQALYLLGSDEKRRLQEFANLEIMEDYTRVKVTKKEGRV